MLSSHLPETPEIEHDFSRNPVNKPFDEKDHPYYHERPAYSFLQRSWYPKNSELDHAKVKLILLHLTVRNLKTPLGVLLAFSLFLPIVFGQSMYCAIHMYLFILFLLPHLSTDRTFSEL